MERQSKVNDALTYFHNGYNCSQAVLATFCEEFGMDQRTAFQVACGLGAGMGRRQETCGAVTGACLLIGLKYGNVDGTDSLAKENTYACVREFLERFEKRNHSTRCRELLGVDMIHDDKETVTKQVQTRCPKMIQDAVEMIEQILFRADSEGGFI